MWILRTEGEKDDRQFRLMPGAIKTAGRARRADFVLDAALVSRLHCRFTATRSGECEVEDLESTNGTYVNGQRVRRATLSAGDRIRIGRVVLVLERQAGRRPAIVSSR